MDKIPLTHTLPPEDGQSRLAEVAMDTTVRAALKAGAAGLRSIRRGQARNFDGWLVVAGHFGAIAGQALSYSGANSRESPVYKKLMKVLLAFEPVMAEVSASERAALININDHAAAVKAWYGQLTPAKARKWQAPYTIWKEFEKSVYPEKAVKAKPANPNEDLARRIEDLVAELAEANGQIDLLKDENAALKAQLEGEG